MKVLRSALASLVAVAAAGCGDGDETSSYALVPVTGNVTLDGKPFEGAKVLFTPQGNVPDTPGSDTTGKEGNYKIMYRGRAGVAPGKYLVSVTKTIGDTSPQPEGESASEHALSAMQSEMATAAAAAKAGKRAAPVIITLSEKREVGPKGEVFDFDVKQH